MFKNKKILCQFFLSAWIYLGWFGCVYFGKIGWEFLTILFPLVSWSLMKFSFDLTRAFMFRLLILLFMGLLFDSCGVYFELIRTVPPAERGFLPIWLISLWFLFISSLPLLQNLLRKKYLLASILGAIFGPLSYSAGAKFGTLVVNGNSALLVYAFFWAVYVPIAISWLGQKDIKNEK